MTHPSGATGAGSLTRASVSFGPAHFVRMAVKAGAEAAGLTVGMNKGGFVQLINFCIGKALATISFSLVQTTIQSK